MIRDLIPALAYYQGSYLTDLPNNVLSCTTDPLLVHSKTTPALFVRTLQ